ncbi:hypothetical protein ABZS88_40080 [Streptomyces sp. NPDC005480]|uniref:hypothetical protein n=1 Tax=Streptomyces sp. NPDC005480 TaxID=3154880 RepID=UPI0033BC9EB9
MSLKAVDKWWAKWQAGGREALVMRPRGKGSPALQWIPASNDAFVWLRLYQQPLRPHALIRAVGAAGPGWRSEGITEPCRAGRGGLR